MARKYTPSAADRAISEHVTGQGYDFSARMVETYRQAKLLPPNRKTSLGFPVGSTSAPDPEVFERALVIAEERNGKRTRTSVIALRLFGRGLDVEDQLLRDAFKTEIERLQQQITRATNGAADDLDAAERLAASMRASNESSRTLRRLLRRSEDLGQFSDALLIVSAAMLGNDISTLNHGDSDAFTALSVASGLEGTHTEQVGEVGPVTSEENLRLSLERNLPKVSLAGMLAYSQRASHGDLLAAARDASNLVEFSEAFVKYLKMTEGAPTAFGLVSMSDIEYRNDGMPFLALALGLLREAWDVPEGTSLMPWAPATTVLYRRGCEMLQRLPRYQRRFLGIEGTARLEGARQKTVDDLQANLSQIRPEFEDVLGEGAPWQSVIQPS